MLAHLTVIAIVFSFFTKSAKYSLAKINGTFFAPFSVFKTRFNLQTLVDLGLPTHSLDLATARGKLKSTETNKEENHHEQPPKTR